MRLMASLFLSRVAASRNHLSRSLSPTAMEIHVVDGCHPNDLSPYPFPSLDPCRSLEEAGRRVEVCGMRNLASCPIQAKEDTCS